MTAKDILPCAKEKLLCFKGKYFSGEPHMESEDLSKRLIKCFVTLAIIFGILIVILTPPFCSPDENTHFLNMCRIVNGNLFLDVEGAQAGNYITQDQLSFYNTYSGRYNGMQATEKFNFWELYVQDHLKMNGHDLVFFPFHLSGINPLAYMVQASGASITANVFGLTNPMSMLMGAKLFTLAFYIAVIAIAIKKTPVLKRTMLLLALMPMSIYQGASISYDAVLIPASMLLFAYAMKILLADKDYRISIEDIIAICFACAFIFSTKIAYAPLVLILLAISIKKFGSLKKYFICIGAVALVGVIFYLAPTLISSLRSSGCTNIGVASASELEKINIQKQYLASNPFKVFPILFNTTTEYTEFWRNGFFGIFGNLDTNFPQFFIVFFYIILFTSAVLELSTIKGVSWQARALSLAGPIIFYIGTIMAMYLEWTPLVMEPCGDISTGTQGRYFIPVFLFVIVIFANPLLKRFKHIGKVAEAQTSVICFTSLVYLILSALILLLRFWAL